MSTRRPFTVQWPWLTSCLAWRREAAKPSRTRTLSRRHSSSRSRFSPVTPCWRLARRVGAPLDAALVGEAAGALEEQLLSLAAALLALGAGIARHQTLLRLRG